MRSRLLLLVGAALGVGLVFAVASARRAERPAHASAPAAARIGGGEPVPALEPPAPARVVDVTDEERASREIDALVQAGRIGDARVRAEEFLAHYPSGALAEHIQALTGVHPHWSGPLPRRRTVVVP